MLAALYIPPSATLSSALATTTARRLVAAGARLFLLPQGAVLSLTRPGEAIAIGGVQ